jgi:hypothetical protein
MPPSSFPSSLCDPEKPCPHGNPLMKNLWCSQYLPRRPPYCSVGEYNYNNCTPWWLLVWLTPLLPRNLMLTDLQFLLASFSRSCSCDSCDIFQRKHLNVSQHISALLKVPIPCMAPSPASCAQPRVPNANSCITSRLSSDVFQFACQPESPTYKSANLNW